MGKRTQIEAPKINRPENYDSEVGLAIVQRLVAADVSGVMFTRDPVTGVDRTVINATWGLAEPLVQGRVTPDTYVVDDEDVTAVTGSKHLRLDLGPAGDGVFAPVALPPRGPDARHHRRGLL